MSFEPYEITTTSLDIIVDVIEPIVGPYRTKYTLSGAKGCPTHFSLLYPFVHPIEVNSELLIELKDFFSEIPMEGILKQCLYLMLLLHSMRMKLN